MFGQLRGRNVAKLGQRVIAMCHQDELVLCEHDSQQTHRRFAFDQPAVDGPPVTWALIAADGPTVTVSFTAGCRTEKADRRAGR